MPKQISTTDFITRASKIHNNYYDYSQTVYTKMHSKVKIIDPKYGEFWQSPMGHLQGQGHPKHGKLKAGNSRRMPIEEFIRKANEKHNSLYDYSKVNYIDCDSKVCIIDPEYGEFWQTPYQHLNSHGCPKRTKEKKWEIHKDHIIPLSIIHTGNRSFNKWFIERPLYQFLNSEINLVQVKAKFNRDKSDFVTINGITVPANSVRNNYKVISYLIKNQLNLDPTDIIKKDEDFVNQYFKL
jgi:hypothetical protein